LMAPNLSNRPGKGVRERYERKREKRIPTLKRGELKNRSLASTRAEKKKGDPTEESKKQPQKRRNRKHHGNEDAERLLKKKLEENASKGISRK